MRGSALFALALAALAPSAVACRRETIDKPPPPDMADVLMVFEAPTGTFDDATKSAVKAAADEAAKGLVGLGLPQKLVDDVRAAVASSQGGDAGVVATEPNTEAAPLFEGEGFAKVTRVCGGWAAGAPPDVAANGSLALTVTFTDVKLDPVIWGIAERCKLLVGASRLLIDRAGGDATNLRIHLGGPVALREIGTRPIVVALGASAQIDDRAVRGDVAVRLLPGASAVEVLVPAGGGQVVVTLSSALVATGVRAKNGTFTCDLAGCLSEQGGVSAW